MSIIFTVDYASNVPVKINEYKCWLFLTIFQTWQWQWPTRKPRLLWLLCTSSLEILFIDICIVYFWKKIIYSVCVRVIHLNSANKVEVARLQHIYLKNLATRVFSFHIILFYMRHWDLLCLPARATKYQGSFRFTGAKICNMLPLDLRIQAKLRVSYSCYTWL